MDVAVTVAAEDESSTVMSDAGKVDDPFRLGAAPVPPKGVGMMVGTDLAGGNE